MTKIDQAWQVFEAILRQHPYWPTTYSRCNCGRMPSRGGSKCNVCLREELLKYTDAKKADAVFEAANNLQSAWYSIYDSLKDDS